MMSSREREVYDAYKESLGSLVVNARPVIMNLTELAHEYSKGGFSAVIVSVIEAHIKTVRTEYKLPALYLMDSIVKNHPEPYKELFQQNIVSTFAGVFATAPEKTRSLMFKLRNTWTSIFTPTKLFQLDNKVKRLDPAWPLVMPAAAPGGPGSAGQQPNIHINPAVFSRQAGTAAAAAAAAASSTAVGVISETNESILEEVKRKERELLELKKKKLQLELEATKREVMEQEMRAKKGKLSTTTTRDEEVHLKVEEEEKPKKTTRDPRIRDKPEVVEEKPKVSSAQSSPVVVSSSTTVTTSAATPTTKTIVPPPPPTIRNDIKEAKEKSPRKSSTKSKSSSSGSSSKNDRSRKSSSNKDSSRSSFKKSGKKSSDPDSKKRDRDLSSSPSPPPSTSGPKSSSPTPRIKDLGRIPKKSQKRTENSPKGGSVGYSEEGPHVEFNEGRRVPPRYNKRRSGKEAHSPPERKMKKKELNLDLFGDEAAGGGVGGGEKMDTTVPISSSSSTTVPLPSPSVGWAKIKETNPDQFHTPIRNNRNGRNNENAGPRFNDFRQNGPQHHRGFNRGGGGGGGRDRLRPQQRGSNFGGGNPNFDQMRQPFNEVGNNHPLQQQQQQPPQQSQQQNENFIEIMLQDAHRVNPEVVRNEVIPTIVREAQESLRSGRMTQLQFSELMRQVMTLKEQAMMVQAERRFIEPFQSSQPSSTTPVPPQQPFFNQQQQQPPQPSIFSNGDQTRPPFRPQHLRDLPPASPEDLELILHDPVKTIPIDDQPREIRLYEETCTIVMADDDVRELSFQPVGMRRVIIDDKIIVNCELDVKHYVDFMLDGVVHKIKIGAPTRELWIDGQWYECFFDNTIRTRVGQNFHTFFLEGPAPTVKIGDRRPDLCPGRVNLIIDGDFNTMVPIYLDAKPQRFDVDGKPHVLRFVEGLKTVLINGHPYRTEFGGMPMVIFVDGIKHFVRLTVLPRGIRPGQTQILNMSPASGPLTTTTTTTTPTITPFSETKKSPTPPPFDSENSNGPLESVDNVGSSSAFDKLLTLFPQPGKEPEVKDGDQYKSEPSESVKKEPSSSTVDVHNLWNQLLGAGLVSTFSGTSSKKTIPGLDASLPTEDEEKEKEKEDNKRDKKKENEEPAVKKEVVPEVKPITLKSHHSTLKERQQGIINQLYDPSALQCKNCGLRYSPCDMIAYSQHLDWHFRIKRREKDNARKAQSRRWYFERLDWIISEEIEDDDKDNFINESGETVKETIPTVPVGKTKEENSCPICKEEFEQFYKDDTDEEGKWLLYNAIKEEDKVFHPQCFQDYQERKMDTSNVEEESVLNTSNNNLEEEASDTAVKEEPTPQVEVKMEVEEAKVEEKPKSEEKDVEKDIKKEPEEPIKDDEESVKTDEKEEPVVEENKTEETDENTVKKENEEEKEEEEAEIKKEEDEELLDIETKNPIDSKVDITPAPLAATKSIRFNLTSQVPGSGASSPVPTEKESDADKEVERKEKEDTEKSVKEESEFDVDAIIQPAKPEQLELKPKLKDRKLVIMPTQSRDGELSGLCSIM